MNVGLLLLRLAVGLTIAAHGTQKLFGWFGGPGLDGTGQFLETRFPNGSASSGDGRPSGDGWWSAFDARVTHAARGRCRR